MKAVVKKMPPRPAPGTPRKKSGSHTIRHKDGGTVVVEKWTRTLAIKAHCTECMGFSNPVDCTDNLCELFPYRKRTEIAIRRPGDEPTEEEEEDEDED